MPSRELSAFSTSSASEENPPTSLLERARKHLARSNVETAGNAESPPWNPAVADAWLAITLARVSRDAELAPSEDPLDPEWDQLERAINTAYRANDLAALRAALDVYEQHARWALGGKQLAARG
jgi:hypothetical protein